MDVGMLWTAADENEACEACISSAIHAYTARFGERPAVCLVRARPDGVFTILGVPVRESAAVAEHRVWMGGA